MTSTAIPKSLNVPSTMEDVREILRVRGRATGALVVGGFGGAWAAAALARAGAPAWAWLLLAVVVLAFGVRALQLLRGHAPVDESTLPADVVAQRRRSGRIFAWAVGGEAVGMLLAVNVAVNLGHPEWQPAAAMAVVGLHFLPLASGFAYRPHLWTGLALTGWAMAYPWLLADGPMAPAGFLGAAAILLASAAGSLRSAGRRA